MVILTLIITFIIVKYFSKNETIKSSNCLKSKFRNSIKTASFKFSIPANIIESILWVESADGQNTNHSSGEIGIMAILPNTEAEIKKEFPALQNLSARNSYDAIILGSAYLEMGYRKWKDWEKAIIGYNAGINSTRIKSANYKNDWYLLRVKEKMERLCQ